MRSLKPLLGAALALALLQTHAEAVTIFSDNFNSENGGAYQTNYTGFAKWDVTGGSVDLISPTNPYGLTADPTDPSMFVDLDGSTGNAGVMTTKNAFNFSTGVAYTLAFRLSGNQRVSTPDDVDINIRLANESYTISGIGINDPWQTITLTFTFPAPSSGELSFENLGGDNYGALLDSVTLTAPDPSPTATGGSTLVMFGLAVFGLARMKRRKG